MNNTMQIMSQFWRIDTVIYPVTEWKMTPEQLAEYVKKHPIKQTKKETVIKFAAGSQKRGGRKRREEN